MRTHTLAALLLLACNGDKTEATSSLGTTGVPSTTSTVTGPTATATATATGTGTGTGTGSSGTTGTGTGTFTGTTALTVDAEAQCGGPAPAVLNATSPAAGEIRLIHRAFQPGCCPTLDATAIADGSTMEIAVTYTITGDYCDCICQLDARVDLTGVPPGSWTVRAQTESALVVVN